MCRNLEEEQKCENLIYNLKFICPSRASQISLIGWRMSRILNLNIIFGACLLWVVAQIAKDISFIQGATPTCKTKEMPPYSSLSDLLRGSNLPRSIVLLHIKSGPNMTGVCIFLQYIKWEIGMMMWCDVTI